MQPFVIHTHFYQPERVHPWTQTLDPEPGAAPFRDWNERVHHECYRPNAYARIHDDKGRVERIVNNYERLSFNLGPTLLAWLERTQPQTYRRILAADRRCLERTGHGNALAQAFHHTILPLDTARDRRTQIRWGLSDFRHRFGRHPAGMWLPETAANDAVVDALIDEGVAFTVLAPRQAAGVRDPGGEWRDVGGHPDPSKPYRILHSDGSGRSLAVFFYDGDLAQRLAFDPKAMDAEVMLELFAAKARGGLLHAALDGETFGHHRRFGELGLAYTLSGAAERHGFAPTSYRAYLAAHPPEAEARLLGGEGSSWSCAHGVDRWIRDCGCATDAEDGWSQAWRTPLRAGLDEVRDAAADAFAELGDELLDDPWAARDDYVEVLIGAMPRAEFLRRHALGSPGHRERSDIWTLLESQRNAMAMYTSCGWFFADISGIETVYVMRFAARVLELLGDLGVKAPRDALLERLGEARSNRPRVGTGADVWLDRVEPDIVTPSRVAVQAALWAAADLPAGPVAEGHDVEADLARHRHGDVVLASGTVHVTPQSTGRGAAFTVAGLGLGGLDLHARVAPLDDHVMAALASLASELPRLSTARLVSELEQRVGGSEAGIDDALPSVRAELIDTVRESTVRALRHEIADVIGRHRHQVELLRAAGATLPPELRAMEQVRVADELERLVDELATTSHLTAESLEAMARLRRSGYDLDVGRLRDVLGEVLTATVRRAVGQPSAGSVDEVALLIGAATDLGLELDARVAQEAVYDVAARSGERPPLDVPPGAVARLGDLLGISPHVWSGRQAEDVQGSGAVGDLGEP